MTIQQKAFSSIFPTWIFIREGINSVCHRTEYAKGIVQIDLIENEDGSKTILQVGDSIFYRGNVFNNVEEALMDVKSYLDNAFPGMS